MSSDGWFAGFSQRVEGLFGEQREWFEVGLRQSPEQFFKERTPWLAAADCVRVTAGPGGYDVVIRVDGSYLDEDEAQDVAALLQAQLYGHLARLRAEPGGF